jgi:signal transduction histidine kinase
VRRQLRPSVAKCLRRSSISRRISLFVALIVTGVVASVSYLQVRAFERTLDRDLVNAAQLGVQSVNENLSAREELEALDIRDVLHDLVDADPFIDAIAIIEADEHGHFHVFTNTSTEAQAEVVDVAGRAIRTKAPVSYRSASELTTAAPVPRHPRYAVAVNVTLASLLHARSHSLTLALAFAIPAIVLVTILVHLTVRWVVEKPLKVIVGTMERTGQGDLGARADVDTKGEFATIATGLNAMLDQLEAFNRSLRKQIDEATRDLSLRNAQLRASQNQLLATRESLARAERVAALGQVAANVAHQAGTPLNLVSGYVQMILDDPATDERTHSRLRTVERQIEQVTRVLRTMLDHARPPLGFETIAVGDVIARVRELAQPRLARANIHLETSAPAGLPAVNADATQLEMALLNLVANALDAMPGGGTLSITASADADHVRLEVADTGPGLPADVLDHLFAPWVTTKPRGQGSGLGLAIVRDVVRAHGGSISAYNRTPGAVFIIDLPAPDAVVTSS